MSKVFSDQTILSDSDMQRLEVLLCFLIAYGVSEGNKEELRRFREALPLDEFKAIERKVKQKFLGQSFPTVAL